ncbi:DUF6602 domain-containing protein [Ornithinibacillus bavariensis]|uniref:DUF6602 domain-containing protein n=1 Tax=Ornithinibacillus bavariensis TaxID=545502 RepID=A0A919X7M5_9BACI|nr:DUF6602 domain-containing protein [Ornithinibacillus bavariensis]GIO27467.1 hypothetical protein J43TS3_20780 [Ornithinibacillus bavariensis]
MNNEDAVSTQCDLVIYDRNYTPLFTDDLSQRFFPVETCIGIGEVKSVLSKKDLKRALNKLAKNKMLRDKQDEKGASIVQKSHVNEYGSGHGYDQLFSFLICEKLDFNTDNILQELDSFYEEGLPPKFKHNVILSLEDGLFTYYMKVNEKSMTVQYPVMFKNQYKNIHIQDKDVFVPFKSFLSYLYNSVQSATILVPDLVNYMGGCENQILSFE